MPRNHAPGPSTLRNRNRVTNKTRLRIIKGNVEGDSLAFDEDEEKARIVSTAGVDAEDANEHHLQAVLSASSIRHQQTLQRATRGAEKAEKQQPDAYIPIPDNTGLVEEYDRFYPAGKWTDPNSFVKTSATAEDAVSAALIDGFTYYMDERDKEWLDKNNEEARGEGTSAQGAVSATGARASRSAKAKGKEPEVAQLTPVNEDEFELIMGIFEKVTHDKTPFLHHGLTEKSLFPPFSDYQETFATPLPPAMFAVFVVPAWVPQPAHMLRLARTIYPYWKERRIERGGHRVIPTLNYDESDVKNESYICFRRRDVKAMRKTRASQASSSEKLIRLQQELTAVQDLSKNLCTRESLKRDLLQFNRAVWEGREKIVDLKRKFPSLGVKEDDDLLVDKERPPKKPKAPEPKIKIPAKLPKESALASAAPMDEAIMKPKDRQQDIANRIEREMQSTRERDQMWDDSLDNSYMAALPTLGQRYLKFVLEKPKGMDEPKPHRAVRARRGRGGIMRIDRRSARSTPLGEDDFMRPVRPRPIEEPDAEDPPHDTEDRERAARLYQQWKFDVDDEPHVGPDGADEVDRSLVNEFDPTFMRKTMLLFNESDNQAIQIDPSLTWSLVDGTRKTEMPFKIGVAFQQNRDRQQHLNALRQQQLAQVKAQMQQALGQNQPAGAAGGVPGQSSAAQQPNGVMPIANPQGSPTLAAQTPIRRSSSAMGGHLRISSSTPMRPPATPTAPPMPATPTQASPPRPTASSPSNSDIHHSAIVSSDMSPPSLPATIIDAAGTPAMPSKPTASHAAITMPTGMPNGFHMNGYAAALMNSTSAGAGVQLANGQQVNMQQLSAYMNMGMTPGSRPAAYIGPNSVNYSVPQMNLKLPAGRQWTTTPAPSVVPGPQANVAIAHSRQQGAITNGGHGSPPRASQSPSMQQQQIVGSTTGY